MERLWLLMALVLGLTGAAIVWTALATTSGRLGRNRFAGVRTRATMASERAWRAAHRAAGPWMFWSGMACVVGAAVLVTVRPGESGAAALGGMFAPVLGAEAIVGSLKAQRAARAPRDAPGG